MGFGIVEPKSIRHGQVPGTARLVDRVDTTEAGPDGRPLKHGKGRNAHIVLVPQPSDSPNDPLNWPQWKKEMTYLAICVSTALGGALGPILSPVQGEIAHQYHVSIEESALPAGYALMTAGIMAYVSHVWARSLGKRGIYIISTAILLATSIWTTQVTTFNGLLAARTVQGLGNGAYESIAVSTIGDLFFVHERGKRIVMFNIATLGMANLAPIAGGVISQKYGWKTQFTIISAFTAVALVLILVAVPEHGNYYRPSIFETDTAAGGDAAVAAVEDDKKTPEEHTMEAPVAEDARPKDEHVETYLQQLRPITLPSKRPNLLALMLRPFICFMYPAVFWGFSVGGLWSAWTVGMSIVEAQIFAGPPNLFSPVKLGYLFVFPFVFIVIGCIVGFLLSDWFPKWAAKRNNGIFEPEFRLILLIPVLLVGIPGIFGFGTYASGRHVHWAAASALQGLIGFASILAAGVSFNYVLDCHRAQSVEVTVALIMLRNFFWFGSSYFLPTWLASAGVSTVWYIVGGLQLGITLLSILVYIYGKVMREAVNRYAPTS
ncbi:hypothetical protein BAUCODRAFT_76266 [Baudoinia panamericana UAMH 10762]|uniref:Major facilitator superfamily (MFS) profile domain-containing protein n=1 Tax=Baudoinia panamericana (strain UAMH 10762) TaxID=717646 RepID=M2MQC7_BAUPA|nr:uncharacterized protein BAUCODRAFT_76266 [Baudoinia panamericana UAMH 10762]EMC93683.1 hypothetical protein BAUCODRAFT_76266 [Baudoinia panamericana UAMH 10762]